MTNQEILSQLAKIDTTSGGLNPVQMPEEFITNLIAEDDFLREIRTVKGIKKEFQLMALNVGSRNLLKGTESTSPSQDDIKGLSITGRSLIPQEAILPYNISFRWLKQNLAGDAGEKQLNAEFMKAFKNDLVDLALNGDKSTPDTDPDYKFLIIADGYRKRISDDSGTNYYERSTNDTDWKSSVFPALLKLLPARFKMNEKELFFICSHDVKEEYTVQLAGRATQLGDSFYTEAPKIYFRGIEIKAIPNCPYGTVILTPKKNLAAGFGDEITLYKEDDTRKRERKYTIETYIDFNYALSQAISWCN